MTDTAYLGPGYVVGTGFSPLDIPNCGLWLEADDGVTLVDGKVSQWNDLSGNGRNFSESAAYRPSYEATGLNNYPTLYFNPAAEIDLARGNDSLIRNVNGVTIFTVFKSVGSYANAQCLWAFFAGAGVYRLIGYQPANTTSFRFSGKRLDTDTTENSDTATNFFETNVPHVYSFISDYANSNCYARRGGIELLADTSWLTDGYTSDTNSSTLIIGTEYVNGAGRLGGRLSAFIVYQRKLTPEELTLLERSYGTKYGITVA